ncbi:MAG TPA: YbaN family protein [Deltaproteobacteria bacterium]|nr:YbaN family protein [Deltaproteobacteria bacterium]
MACWGCFYRYYPPPRSCRWLTTNRWCGAYIRNYQEGRGMTLGQKLLAISMLWLAIGYSAFFAVSQLWIKVLLLLIALGVTAHLLKINTYRPTDQFPP